MDTTGRLVGITRDILTGKLNVTFQIDSDSIDEIDSLSQLEKLCIIAKKFTKKRSLDANAYFHVLVGKLADKRGITKTMCKNLLITGYGQQEFLDDGQQVILKSNIQVEKMYEQEFLHCLPCRCLKENGKEVVFYKVYRGSHTYSSQEMYHLIEGTIQECKEQGIETLTPSELQRMVEAWQTKGSAS